ncbi:DNA topoisomerase III [Ruminiclostridium cellobioparum]|uniref:DNA topoisomerase III n=1 Tax=Ruminiclostridium cellobioparum TaxID=29355 RepID=UPI0028A6DC89|nr:DNA topoisomerase III [Ruminiclostridium cellobioparum]
MGRTLVLTEKPDVGRNIARILNCTQNGKGGGFLLGNDYVVTWAIGHLVTLCEAKDYDKTYKKWSFDTLPIIPKQMQIKVIYDTEKQFLIIKSLMNDPGIDNVIFATDAGREGELIARLIYIMAGCTKPIYRLWISSLTDEAILQGFSNIKPGKEYDNIFYSALCRYYADWIVGINSTRAYSIKYSSKLTLGRVQTPTLALIVNKQKEIDSFKSKDYWEIEAMYDKGFNGNWLDTYTSELRIYDKSKAIEIVEKCKHKNGIVKNVEEDDIKESPPLLYDLTELQRDANRKFGYTAQETLDIAQKLYEKKKYITYPRTDCRYLSDDIIPSLIERIEKLNVEPYRKLTAKILNLIELPLSKRIVDNSKLSDHHAIIPTPIRPNLASLSEDEENIYDLIVRRFLSTFYSKYEYTIKSVYVEIEKETFISKGKTVTSIGWMECYIENSDPDIENEDNKKNTKGNVQTQELPPISKGDKVNAIEIKSLFKKTKPPLNFTEATLLSAMENVGRYVEDQELKDKLKEVKGIGTPATRASIIEKLIETEYIKRRNKYIVPTEKGMKLIDIVHEELKSPEMTGEWEKALAHVSKGKMNMDIFMNCIIDFTRQVIEEIKQSEGRNLFNGDDSGKRNYYKR